MTKKKAPPKPVENPEALSRYVSLLREVDLIFPDRDAEGRRNGPVDVCQIARAVRRALAECPEVDKYGAVELLYAVVGLIEAATDIAEVYAQQAEDWPRAKRLLDKHLAAQTAACTALGGLTQFELESAQDRRARKPPGSL